MLIRTVGFKLIQDSGLQIAETGGRNFTDSSQVLSRQIVHNTVGSLSLTKNALHSPTSILCIDVYCASNALKDIHIR